MYMKIRTWENINNKKKRMIKLFVQKETYNLYAIKEMITGILYIVMLLIEISAKEGQDTDNYLIYCKFIASFSTPHFAKIT